MKNSSTTELYILKCLKNCWLKLIKKIELYKNFDAFTTNCSDIYHADELPELPSKISAILSIH